MTSPFADGPVVPGERCLENPSLRGKENSWSKASVLDIARITNFKVIFVVWAIQSGHDLGGLAALGKASSRVEP
jgi:hypothetical protein